MKNDVSFALRLEKDVKFFQKVQFFTVHAIVSAI